VLSRKGAARQPIHPQFLTPGLATNENAVSRRTTAHKGKR
jgi:hypothetical protein